MAGEWVEKTLGDLIEIKHGFAFQGEFFRDEPPGDILLTPGNFAIGGGFKADKLKYYDGPVPEEFVLQEGDLIVTMTDLSKNADTLGYPSFVPRFTEGRRYLHNQRLGKVLPKDREATDLRYLHYLMCSREYRHEVIASATGTTVKHTSPERIKRFRFLLPPPPEQRAIAYILGTLDDKIELNRRMDATLDAMARALFKSWFVDFDPVRAKAEGRDPGFAKSIVALFPTAFDQDGLPLGWRIEPLLNHARLVSGGTPKTEESAYWNGSISWASAKDVSQCADAILVNTERSITERGLYESTTRIIPQFSTVIVARGATTGRFCMFGRDMAMNQTCYALVSQHRRPFWLNCAFESAVEALVHAAHGSVFNTITTRTIEGARVVVASDEVLNQFEAVVTALFGRILANIEESRTLGALRDALLPKLIAGELHIKTRRDSWGAPSNGWHC